MISKRTSLFETLQKSSAKFVSFAGWEMPLQFSEGVLHEQNAVRKKAGLFDIGHMGKIRILGKGSEKYLQKLTVNDVSKIDNKQAQYTAMCNETGCPLDDMVLYRLAPESYRLVVNASNFEKIWEHMNRHLIGDVTLKNLEADFDLIALQGPRTSKILAKLTDFDLDSIKYYCFDVFSLCGEEALVARLGYTGEDGFEIMCPQKFASELWKNLIKAGEPEGIKPCGLASRDLLRIEVCYPLYGQELDEEHTLLESKSGWIVKLDKGNFIGAEALRRQKDRGLPQKLIAFQLVKGIPRNKYKICDPETKEEIGKVTSGTMSPELGVGIGLGFVQAKFAETGAKILIKERTREFEAEVVKGPFYKKK